MATNEEKKSIVDTLRSKIEAGHNISKTQLVVPPHKSGLCGVDTTRMYLKLDETKQITHSTRITAVAKDESARSARRSDVLVSFVASKTNLIRVDMNTKTNEIVFTINSIPMVVLRRKKDELLNGLSEILHMCTTVPVLKYTQI